MVGCLVVDGRLVANRLGRTSGLSAITRSSLYAAQNPLSISETTMQRFENKVALVTGSGSGIGLATAHRLRDEGATVVCTVQNTEQLSAVSDFDALVLDVTEVAHWANAKTHLENNYDGLDILVNNAGIIEFGTVEDMHEDAWWHVLDVNLASQFRGCKMAVPLMRKRGGGAIVNLASINSIRGNVRTVAYSASKGGSLAFTMAAALDHIADNIRINCVCPGSIDTEMIQSMFRSTENVEAMRQAVISKHPIGRLAKAEEVAAVVAFLASEDASFMTGMAIPVDGARSIR
ncbi:MAG: meso-butanediol dehydrogenase/(S,S)-butanediol dehydrogenase/diacetyl reductase [Gammaproteobacteria bacterium]